MNYVRTVVSQSLWLDYNFFKIITIICNFFSELLVFIYVPTVSVNQINDIPVKCKFAQFSQKSAIILRDSLNPNKLPSLGNSFVLPFFLYAYI